MTTIAFRDGVMAADSCLSAEDECGNSRYVGKVKKIFRLKDGSLFGQSGDGECWPIINILESGVADCEIAGLLGELKVEADCLFVRKNGHVFYVQTSGEGYGEFTRFKEDFAYGALEHGATALEAVKCAARRHMFTRGPFAAVELN